MNEQTEVKIKTAEAEDLPQIIEIARESNLSDWKTSDYLEEIISQNSIFLTATKRIEVVGFVIARLITSDFCGDNVNATQIITTVRDDFAGDVKENVNYTVEIFNIAVRLSERRLKIGQKLLDALLTKARKRGAIECWLEVRASNDAAHGFYRKNGFGDVGRRRNYYSNPDEDAILMSLSSFSS